MYHNRKANATINELKTIQRERIGKYFRELCFRHLTQPKETPYTWLTDTVHDA